MWLVDVVCFEDLRVAFGLALLLSSGCCCHLFARIARVHEFDARGYIIDVRLDCSRDVVIRTGDVADASLDVLVDVVVCVEELFRLRYWDVERYPLLVFRLCYSFCLHPG